MGVLRDFDVNKTFIFFIWSILFTLIEQHRFPEKKKRKQKTKKNKKIGRLDSSEREVGRVCLFFFVGLFAILSLYFLGLGSGLSRFGSLSGGGGWIDLILFWFLDILIVCFFFLFLFLFVW